MVILVTLLPYKAIDRNKLTSLAGLNKARNLWMHHNMKCEVSTDSLFLSIALYGNNVTRITIYESPHHYIW